MNRYIDADATELAVVKATTYGDALRAVREQPSIDIVRCKECVKRIREDCPMCNGCKLDRVPTEDDDFCSYGEREGE